MMFQLSARRAPRRPLTTSIWLLLPIIAPVLCQAAPLISQSVARSKAINLLKGDPYGQTPQDVARNIDEGQLIMSGGTRCGGSTQVPVWQFHVLVPAARNPSGENDINGYLLLDARTGKLTCAGLPFLD